LPFEAPDPERFPALRLAQEALRAGGAMPTVLNAANEVAVEAFLARKLGFGGIARLVGATMDRAARGGAVPLATVDDMLAVDHNARNTALALLPEIALKAS
jgi:1-deoxy-D-xylulose-5-phosphate reductoisomerase